MTTKTYAAISTFIFILVAIVHLIRLIFQWDVSVGTWQFPIWGSLVAVAVASYLSFIGFQVFQDECDNNFF